MMTAVFIRHVNVGNELMRALASPGTRVARGTWAVGEAEGGLAAVPTALPTPVPQQRSPGREGLCYQPEG